MQGLHLTADLQGCSAQNPLMTEVNVLQQRCLSIVALAGLKAVGQCFHAFPAAGPEQAGGVTGMVLLAESHLAVHTWPESGVVTLDVFVCNRHSDSSTAAHQVVHQLREAFKPSRCQVQEVPRNAQN
ncbi:adenosylmethionine decarboxylase [Aquabacterium sp.]|uniref:adenosylmethionine decarboxylase n=1 Tax=Aquabacterium sp. TaxID=1872578 RepID=UPI002486FCF6|nr:adenosylmethionine decarboxylase [Aquabacterium sp.]MDI1259840.1 adenosylmethionine decarboxylase [Aquabacterium sp.]